MAPDREEELKMMTDRAMRNRALEKLKEIQNAMNEMYHEKFIEKRIPNELYTIKLRKKEMILKHDLSNLLRSIYQSEMMKSIPNFWLIAFLSHDVLGHLLSEEDQKIFEFLTYMDVEYTKSDDQLTGYMITLKFSENPYFENASLTKTFSFSPSGVTHIKGPSIKWKDGMDITTGPRHEIFLKRGHEQKFTDSGTSFFTWFCDNDDLYEGLCDEVAKIIIDDLWPNAFEHFFPKTERTQRSMLGEEDELQSSMLKVGDALDQINNLGKDAMSKLQRRYEIKKWEVAMFVDQRFRKSRRPLYEERNCYIRWFPDFWRTAVRYLSPLWCLNKFRSRLTKEDIKVFTFLNSLEVNVVEDVKYGYSITLNFDVNPYFENSNLTKTFVFSNGGISSVTCTKIKWKEGRDITCRLEENIPVTEWDGYTDESFFTWFSDPVGEDTFDLGLYDQLAEHIADDLWPNAIKYFLM
ncbi:hypothetical protein MKW92_042653, partial [Papaver armeniacum]